MVSAGSYLLSAVELAVLALSLGFSAARLRRRLIPDWQGAPARLVEAILAIALLTWLSELLGALNLFYEWVLLGACVLLAAVMAVAISPISASPAGGTGEGGRGRKPRPQAPLPRDRTRSQAAMSLIALAVVALVFAHWGLTAKDALGRGIFNFDSLWYHMPFAADMVQSHSLTGLHYTDTVFTNWFYPQNSELLHAVGILLTGRDTLSLFINFGWLAIAFLSAWCIGRPYDRGHLSVVAAAIVLECHTLVVREPGAAKNDLVTAALLLAAIAILINAWAGARAEESNGERGGPGDVERDRFAGGTLPLGWPLAIAGLAVGLAAGTKFTVFAMGAALTVAVIVLAPAGRRWAAVAWWALPALAGCGFWYLRNLIVAGNPLPEIVHLGPIALPHPERLQSARPDFSIVHYATDTGVWRHYFAPGLHDQFGALWPLVVGGALAAAILAVVRGRDRIVRWIGGVVLFGMVAYLFTPLTAAGAEGAPLAFAINIRYVVPALLAALVLLPLPRAFDQPRRQWALLFVLLVVLLLTDRSDAVLRDPDRLFGIVLATLVVLIPAGLFYARTRGVALLAVMAGSVGLIVAIAAIGYPLQRDYLSDRYRNADAATSIPGMNLDSAYRWARGVSNARIGLSGTTAGFLQYGFFGTDLSNRVVYLGAKGPHGAFNAISTCTAFRAAVNDARLDYLITAPFLNFLNPGNPTPSPEAGWLRGEPAVVPIERSGPVTVWRVRGPLDPSTCGPANAPFRRIPNTPGA